MQLFITLLVIVIAVALVLRAPEWALNVFYVLGASAIFWLFGSWLGANILPSVQPFFSWMSENPMHAVIMLALICCLRLP